MNTTHKKTHQEYVSSLQQELKLIREKLKNKIAYSLTEEAIKNFKIERKVKRFLLSIS